MVLQHDPDALSQSMDMRSHQKEGGELVLKLDVRFTMAQLVSVKL
jgi:hypothetical protein